MSQTAGKRAVSVRVVNLPLLIFTVLAVIVLVPMGYFWHGFQMRRIAAALIARADVLAETKDWAGVADYVYRYLQIQPHDAQARIRLARTYDSLVTNESARNRAIDLYYDALGVAPKEEQTALRRRLAELLLEQGRFTEAELEATKLVDLNNQDAAALRIVALALYGQYQQSRRTESQQTESAKQGNSVGDAVERAVVANPRDNKLAISWAMILRDHPQLLSEAQRRKVPTRSERESQADAVVNHLVDDQLEVPAAYLARYEYRNRYQLAGAELDLAEALRLGPNDAAVVLVAARHYQEAAANGRSGGTVDVQNLEEQAINLYRRLIDELSPQDENAYLGMCDVYRTKGNLEKSIEIARQGLDKIGNSNLMLNTRLTELYVAANRHADAEASLERLDRLAADAGVRWNDNLRSAWNRSRDLLEATLRLKKNEPISSRNGRPGVIPLAKPITVSGFSDASERFRAWMLLGDAYSMLSNWDQAAIAFENAAGLDSKNVSARVAAGSAWLRASQPDRAAEQFESALAQQNSLELALQLATAWFAQQTSRPPAQRNWKRFEQVMAQITASTDWKKLENPWRVELLQADHALARAREASLDSMQLTKIIEQLIPLEQQYSSQAPVWRELAIRYEQLGAKEKATFAADQFLKLDRSKAGPRLLAARIHAMHKDYERAQQLLTEDVAELPTHEVVVLRLGLVDLLTIQGKVDEAQQELSAILENDKPLGAASSELLAANQMSELALDRGNLAQAQIWEDRLRSLEGIDGTTWRHAQIRRLLRTFANTTDSQARSRLLSQLEQSQGELQQLRPSWHVAHSLRGAILELQNDPVSAIEAYRTAITLGDSRTTIYERLIALLYGQRQFAEADAYLAQMGAHVTTNSESLTSLAISVAAGMNQLSKAESLARQSAAIRPQDTLSWIWLGQVLALNKKTAEAEQALRKAVELAPHDVRAWNGLFSFQIRQNQRDDARQTLLEMTKAARLNEAERLFVVAQGYDLLGDVAQAEQNYRSATLKVPDNLAIWTQFASFMLRVDSRRADPVLQRVQTLAEKNETTRKFADGARRTRAALLAARGEFDEAMKLLQQQNGTDRDALNGDQRLQALLLVQRTDPDLQSAQKLLENLVINQKTGEDADHLLLATVYVAQGDRLSGEERAAKRAAARVQLESLCLRPNAQVSHLLVYIVLLLDDSQWADADRAIDRLQQLAPNDSRGIRMRARWLYLQDRAKEIVPIVEAYGKRLEESMKEESQQASFFATIASIYTSCELHADAEPWLRRAVSLDKKRYVALANSLLGQNRLTEAVALCQQEAESNLTPESAATLAAVLVSGKADVEIQNGCSPLLEAALVKFPDHVGLILAMANLRVLQHRTEESIAMYRNALRLDPRNVLVLNNLATVLSETPGKADEALEYVERAIQIRGPQAPLLDTKGMALVHDNRPGEAVEVLERATSAHQSDPRFHFHLAVALQRVEKIESAKTAFQTAIRNDLRGKLLTDSDTRLLNEVEPILQTNPVP